jgi:hypothetical protein
MSATADSVRDKAVMPMECDIPPGMTITEYRSRRRRRVRRRRLAAALWPFGRVAG